MMPGHPHYCDLNFGLYLTQWLIDVTHNYAWLEMDSGFLELSVGQCALSAPGSSNPIIPH
jgi:hypothetical protein